MSRRNLILHIGFPKTGTTALQLFLRRNAGKLKELGIFYPDMGYAFHHRFARFFMKNQKHPEVERVFKLYMALDESIRNSNETGTSPTVDGLSELNLLLDQETEKIVISTEVFVWYWNQIDFGLLRKALSKFSVQVIAYLRPQAHFIEGAYRQSVQGEENRSTQEFADYFKYFDLNSANYLQILDLWSDAFGMENMVVIPYQRETLFGKDIKLDFLKRIGIPVETMSFDHEIKFDNISHCAITTELIRRFNHMDISARKRFDLRRRLQVFDNEMIEKYGDLKFMSKEQHSQIARYYKKSNRALALKYLSSVELFSAENQYEGHFKGLEILDQNDFLSFNFHCISSLSSS